MESNNYHNLLEQLFLKKLQTANIKSWNYQCKGNLYFSSNQKVKPIKCVPLSWEKPFRIARHPEKNVYAYATSQTPDIKDNETSCICLYYPAILGKSKYYHRQSDYPNHGFDIKPAFSFGC